MTRKSYLNIEVYTNRYAKQARKGEKLNNKNSTKESENRVKFKSCSKRNKGRYNDKNEDNSYMYTQ